MVYMCVYVCMYVQESINVGSGDILNLNPTHHTVFQKRIGAHIPVIIASQPIMI
jgi:hypothetical protein